MKATRQNRQDLFDSFNEQLNSFTLEMRQYVLSIVEVTLRNEDVKFDHDYSQFGKEAFVYKLKSILDKMESDESIMKQVNEIINDKYQ